MLVIRIIGRHYVKRKRNKNKVLLTCDNFL